jgi:hypothetical protein
MGGHLNFQGGVSGNQLVGCDSIVVSGLGPDGLGCDKYTELMYAARCNQQALALVTSYNKSLPVWVFRSKKYESPLCALSTTKEKREENRYDGLYKVTSYEVPLAKDEPLKFFLERFESSGDQINNEISNKIIVHHCVKLGTMMQGDIGMGANYIFDNCLDDEEDRSSFGDWFDHDKKEAPVVDEVVRNPTLPPILVRPTLLALRPAHTGQLFVGNTCTGVTIEEQSGRQTGKRNRVLDIRRGADIVPRKKRQCRRCLQHGGTKGILCKGRSPKHGARGCQFFDESGGVVTRKKRQCRRCRRCLQHGGTKAILCKGRSPKHGARGCQFFDESGGVQL